MGFKTGAYAKIWDIREKTPSFTMLRITISKRQQPDSDNYIDEFSGWCWCLGATTARAALGLHVGDKIQLGDVDVQHTYNSETKETSTFFKVFSFKKVENDFAPAAQSGTASTNMAMANGLDPLDVPDGSEEEGLPF